MSKMSKKTAKKQKIPFDQALKKLEEVVKQLEEGDLPLEDSIRLYEEGMKLTQVCSRKLEAAEQKIEMLVRDQEGKLKSVPFPPEEPEN